MLSENEIEISYHRGNSFTPLRYPGGKTCLYKYFEKIIRLNGWKNVQYVEPYAGGAGAALALLFMEQVSSIVINDFDPAVYAFWKSAVEDADRLIELIEKTPVNMDEWHRQKEIYAKADTSDLLGLGFATFFLNRTNRSGILTAGVIGGKNQTGKWKIDARYNVETLIRKIRMIDCFQNRITVLNEDGIDVIAKYIDQDNAFLYVDPPYYVKGSSLYLSAFNDEAHRKLANQLNRSPNANWLLSYDNVEEISSLYFPRRSTSFDLRYSASHSSKRGKELMIFSDSIVTSKSEVA